MIIRTTRRTFVRGAAASVLVAPFLRIIENRAEAATPAKRLILFMTPAGLPGRFNESMDLWMGPTNTTFGTILKPLEPFKSKILPLRGLDNRAGNIVPDDHQTDWAAMLTGRAPRLSGGTTIMGQSVENYI